MAENYEQMRKANFPLNNETTIAEQIAFSYLSLQSNNFGQIEASKEIIATLLAIIVRLRKKTKVLARRVQKMKQKTCRFEYTITKRGEHISFGYKCTNCNELYMFNSFKYCPNCGHKIVDMS